MGDLAVTPVDVLRTVAVLCGRSRADMVGGSHRRDVSEDRHVAMYVARIVTGAPYTELAGVFRRSESTVRYGVRTVRRRMRHSSLLAEKVRVVEEQVRKNEITTDGVDLTYAAVFMSDAIVEALYANRKEDE